MTLIIYVFMTLDEPIVTHMILFISVYFCSFLISVLIFCSSSLLYACHWNSKQRPHSCRPRLTPANALVLRGRAEAETSGIMALKVDVCDM